MWDEPRVPNPPRRVSRDWFVFAAVLLTVGLEGLLHTDLVWRPVAVLFGFGLAPALLWRRTHPFSVLALTFGVIFGLDIIAGVFVGSPIELYSSVVVLILVYSLFRWGSGRECAAGMVVMAYAVISSAVQSYNGIGDLVGGAIVLLLPALLGAVVRFQGTSRQQQLEQARLHEREQLARELHDTVAHHVSAIAIQAQAGQVLAATSPDGAAKALAVIEEEASRTLSEMRSMIGLLRDAGSPSEMVPQRGLADLGELAQTVSSDGPTVRVEVDSHIGPIGSPTEAAIYRIVQEAITNALRHARSSTHIGVRVCGDADAIHVTIDNDGQMVPRQPASSGYGMIGMSERVAMLGGTLAAGPRAGGGWTVSAYFPRNVVAA